MCEYKSFRQRLCSPYLGEYDTWGIACVRGGKTVRAIDDVGCDEAMVRRLVQTLNQCGVLPCHFTDVVLDSLE